MSTGLGVLIHTLAGTGHGVEVMQRAVGQTIAAVEMRHEGTGHDEADLIWFRMADGLELAFWDDGQSCCEQRYMTCDDDLSTFVGAKLVDVEVADGSSTEDDWESHDTQFLRLHTDAGVIVVCTHNEHNGYYGGFFVRCRKVTPS